MEDLVVLPRPEESLQIGAELSRKTNKLGLRKKKVISSQGCWSRFCQEEKELSHQSRSQGCEMGESRGGQKPRLGE